MEIAYICIFASNFDESIAFYRDVLGLQEIPERLEKNFHAFKAGSTNIGIERNGTRKDGEKTKAENAVLIQFKARSLDELKKITANLETKNVRFLKKLVETHYGSFTNFLDPDGNKLEILYQP
ncbi:MAG: VOC family protein [Candidatus Pacebacteria bacterium]|nr:VOC family protein [Candidatus Paceibacterota bacterium]MDD5357159.1 VOC family protein [Candidatus Paceibacterota bacterium]